MVGHHPAHAQPGAEVRRAGLHRPHFRHVRRRQDRRQPEGRRRAFVLGDEEPDGDGIPFQGCAGPTRQAAFGQSREDRRRRLLLRRRGGDQHGTRRSGPCRRRGLSRVPWTQHACTRAGNGQGEGPRPERRRRSLRQARAVRYGQEGFRRREGRLPGHRVSRRRARVYEPRSHRTRQEVQSAAQIRRQGQRRSWRPRQPSSLPPT